MRSIQKGCVPFCPKKKRDLDHGELFSLYKTFLRNLALFGIPPRPPSPSPAFNHRFIYKLFSFLKNKTQTAVINIVSYHRCLCYIFDPTAMVKFLSPSPPLPLNVRKAVASISCYKWVWRTDSSDVSGWYPMFKSVSDFRDWRYPWSNT